MKLPLNDVISSLKQANDRLNKVRYEISTGGAGPDKAPYLSSLLATASGEIERVLNSASDEAVAELSVPAPASTPVQAASSGPSVDPKRKA